MIQEKRQEYTKLLKGRLSKHRYEHSLCVCEEAVRLAKKYGADVENAELAGLLHDIMKEEDADAQRKLITRYCRETKRDPSPLLVSEKLLHAPAGAAYCRYELGIKDKEVLDAIYYHTTACADMPLLAQVIYVADFTSRDRDYKDVDVMRRYADRSLDDALRYALSYTIKDLIGKKCPLNLDTVRAYNCFIR